MLDGRQEGNSYRPVEVITGQRRRRRWTGEEKARFVAKRFEVGANISEVARRNGVAVGLLTVWRRQVAAVAGKAPSFVPIQIGAESGGGTAGELEGLSSAQVRIVTPPTETASELVEVEVSGAHIRPVVDLATLAMLLSTLLNIRCTLRPDLKVVLAAHPVVASRCTCCRCCERSTPCERVLRRRMFHSKRMDRVKLLAWDDSGMVLVMKVLHQGRLTRSATASCI